MPKHISAEERARRMAVITAGEAVNRTVADMARELRIGAETLRRWIELQHAPRGNRRKGSVPTTTRNCLRCDEPFESEGAGNRMCDYCRTYAPTLDTAYCPDPGGSRGRRVSGRRVTAVGP